MLNNILGLTISLFPKTNDNLPQKFSGNKIRSVLTEDTATINSDLS
jgi:hypothetical protein